MPEVRGAGLALVAAATAPVAAIAVVSARGGPAWALAGASSAALAAELAAAVALVAAGLAVGVRGADVRSGALLALAGLLRVVAEWNNPDGAPGALVFTTGLVLAAAAPAPLAHALLAHGDGRVGGPVARTGIVAAYVGAGLLLGIAPAVVSAPGAEGCASCPADVLQLGDAPALASDLRRSGLAVLFAALSLATLLALARLARTTPARRRIVAPVVLPGCLALGLAAGDAAHGWSRGFASNDPIDRRLWLGQAIALGLLAVGVAWQRLRARRVRARLARTVVQLRESPQPGGLRAALAAALGDPALELIYTDDNGKLNPAPDDDRTATRLVRDGRVVAALVHRRGLLDDPDLVAELTRTAALAFEHDRLNAELRSQLQQLRASRTQIVALGDAERRRIERDLHDGAQQALAGLAMAIGLARADADDPERSRRLGAAHQLVRDALSEVRSLAHATSPAALADSGLAAALDVLAEWTPELELVRVPDERLDRTVESTAYFVVGKLARRATGPVRVDARVDAGRLVVEVSTSAPPASMVELEDRVGAVDGELDVRSAEGGLTVVRVALPCAS